MRNFNEEILKTLLKLPTPVTASPGPDTLLTLE